jgi:signal peptidase I
VTTAVPGKNYSVLRRIASATAWIAVLLVGTAQAGCQSGLRIVSSSMEPTLHCAKPAPGCESTTADELDQVPDDTLERGDIIAFRVPARAEAACGGFGETRLWVKRLIGLPGEHWSISKGVVYIDGRRLREPYISAKRRDLLSFAGGRIPKAKYFVLGDNRRVSCDSRLWGYMPAKDVVAHVVAVERNGRRVQIP